VSVINLRLNLKHFLVGLFVGLLGFAATAVDLGAPFATGTTISSSQMNAKLNALNAGLPGFARSVNTGGVDIADSGVTSVLSAEITVPGEGFVIAEFHGIGEVLGTSQGNIILGVVTGSGDLPAGGRYTVFGAGNESLSASTYRWGSMTTERGFSVASAGTYTYYANAFRGWAGGTATVHYTSLKLTFYPATAAIGPVATGVSEGLEPSHFFEDR
jgi:hypothetical protein